MNLPIAVFLHGGPGFRDYLKPFFQDLDTSFECVFYDQVRGTEVGIAHFLDQLDEIVNARDAPVILVGHSWGAILGIEYTARNPEKVSGLTLISTGLSHVHWFMEFQKEKERLGLVDASAEQIYLTHDEMPEGKPLLDHCWESFSEETFDSLNRSYVVGYDLIPKFSTLQIPILNIFGEKDVRFPLSVTKTFSKVNSNVVDLEVKGSGHFPFLKQAGRDQVHQALRNMFLES